jgi:hypothetical protein
LRRLGQSPLQGKFPLVGLLASIYDSIAENGRKLRDEVAHREDAQEGTEVDEPAE